MQKLKSARAKTDANPDGDGHRGRTSLGTI
jgi:hypothetical protein